MTKDESLRAAGRDILERAQKAKDAGQIKDYTVYVNMDGVIEYIRLERRPE